jgi:hypothetical protein
MKNYNKNEDPKNKQVGKFYFEKLSIVAKYIK